MDNSKFLTALGVRIKALRVEQNLSQQELAGLCDFEKANMSRIENGVTNPTILTLLKISLALKIDLCDLLQHEDLRSFKADE